MTQLTMHKKSPQFKDMRKLRKFVNQLFDRLDMKDTNISRHTIRYWIENYEPKLESYILFKDVCRYVSKRDKICKIARKNKPNLKTLPRGSHLEGLKEFCEAYGKEHVLKMIRSNNDAVYGICRFFGWGKIPKKASFK